MISLLRALPAAPYRAEAVVFAGWAVLFLTGLYFHEPWSDEVRAYSLMREGGDPVGIFFGLRNEGHPVLWYWLMWAVEQVVDAPQTLKVTTAIIAFATAAMVLFRMPLPLFLRILVVLSVLGLHELQIIARNYGISFLLLLLIVDTAIRRPERHWVFLPLLVLFANTNAYATVMTPFIAGALLWNHIWAALLRFERRSIVLLAVYGAALLVAALAAWYAGSQDELTAVRPYEREGGRTLNQIIWDLRGAFGYVTILESEYLPTRASEILKKSFILLMALSLAFSFRFFTAGGLALVAWIALSGLVYRGSDRHVLMLVITLFGLFIMMLSLEGRHYRGLRARLLPVAIGFWGLSFLWLNDLRPLVQDIRLPFTGAYGAVEMIRADGGADNAIVVSDTGYHVEAMPYFLPEMRLYQEREGRFRPYTRLTRESRSALGIGEIIETARRLKAENPEANVYFVTDQTFHEFVGEGRQELFFRWYTSWNEAEIEVLRREFEVLGYNEGVKWFESLWVLKLKE